MDKLNSLRELSKESWQQLVRKFPEQRQAGGCLLLGRCYACQPSGVLMLGLNPGGAHDGYFDVSLQDYDWLLEGPLQPRHAYWTNARKVFNATPDLARAMRQATYAFCCPFRTPDWSSLSPPLREALLRASVPILRRIVEDCQPKLAIVAGVESVRIFSETTGSHLVRKTCQGPQGDGRGTYQWAAYDGSLGSVKFVLAQIPHLSRAGSRVKLADCATWLSGIVKESA
jgi:hypothetical protein